MEKKNAFYGLKCQKNLKNASIEFFPFPFRSSNKGLLGMSMVQGYIIHLYIYFLKINVQDGD